MLSFRSALRYQRAVSWLGDARLRVCVFVCPEDFPYDTEPDVEPEEKRALQRAHRAAIIDGPRRYETPREAAEIGGGLVWMKRGQTDMAAQMTQVQEALSRLQQSTDPRDDPISQWPQERLERALAEELKMEVADLRALLAAGRTSLDALVAGQALLASGERDAAGEKFDLVLQQEKAAAERMRRAWEGKAQIAWDAAKYEQALEYRQEATALVDKDADPLAWTVAAEWVGKNLQNLARYTEAEPPSREIVRMREIHLGPNHPELASALCRWVGLVHCGGFLGCTRESPRRSQAPLP